MPHRLSALLLVFLLPGSLAGPVAVAQHLPLAVPQGKAAAPTSLEDRRKVLNDLFDEYWQDQLRRHPEFASALGDKRYDDRITDYSPQAINAELGSEQELLVKLASVDPAGMDEQMVLSHELLMRTLTEAIEGAEFKPWEMSLNQMEGIHTVYPELVRQLSFTTVKDYDDWIARLHKIPTAFDQVTENLSLGMDELRVPPKFLLEQALKQVQELAGQKPEESPLALPLKSFPAGISAAEQQRIHDEMLAAIGKEVLPAYQRFARFLAASYVPAGRTEPGIWAIPDGDRYYQFLIKQETTTKLTANQLHQTGLDEVARDEAQMTAIAHKLGFADLKSFQASLRSNPRLHPASAEALMAAYKGYLGPMEAKLPGLFGHLPKAQLEVVAIPAYRAGSAAAAYYEEGSADGRRPGRITVNLSNATERSLVNVEAIAYHEGIPGHHLQISIGQELTGVPEFRRHEGYTAFVEGWALYSERLGKEVGFYADPYSDYGRVENDMWRAIRLVVDTGVHSEHWTRQQMIDYFHQYTSMDEPNIQSEVDRYIGWPAQALAYKSGQLRILALREKAQQALGPRFDLRAFHDEVLGAGALPLDVLEQRVDGWIASQK